MSEATGPDRFPEPYTDAGSSCSVTSYLKKAVLDLPSPLLWRSRLPGDVLRQGGRTLDVRKLLTDARIPADCRSGLPVLTDGETVYWVPLPGTPAGRIADGFSPDPHEPCLKLTVEFQAYWLDR